MVKVLSLCVCLLIATVRSVSLPTPFSGSIVYEHEYQTLAGETLYFAVKPKSWFYVQGNNLKVYDRHKKLQELYLGATNDYYRFEKGQVVPAIKAIPPASATTFKCLPTTATILGHSCEVLQLVQDGIATLVFYSPELRVNATDFSRCSAPGWYKLLQATDGALPLRTITVDTQRDVVATSEAIGIQARPLAADEFSLTAPAR
jgi:hypothetical protein